MNNEIKEIHISFPGQILDYVDTKEHLLDLFNYITNLEQENKILRKNAEHNDKVVDNARWNEMIYKSRNKKAIEYIKSYKNDYAPYELSNYNIRELLNILGGDEE